LTANEEFLPLELLVPIRDPEKDPTPADLESLQPHPSLLQALQELQPINLIGPMLVDYSDDELEFQLEKQEELVELVADSSDGDEDGYQSDESNDSITRNADFISFV
jgi:hypothetical protein